MSKGFLYLEKRVVVVDDVKLNHTIIKKILGDYKNLHLEFIQDSRDVMPFLEKNSPVDLVILDWEMPYLNGPEVCRQLKAHEKFKNIPVMFCTANPSATTIAEAFDVGAQDYINKPVCPPELLARMERLFQSQELTKVLQQRFEEKNEMTRILSHDLNNYISLISVNIEVLKKKGYGKDEYEGKAFDKIAKTCLRMAELIRNVRDFQAIEDKKHSLKVEKVNVLQIIQEALSNFEDKMDMKGIKVDLSEATIEKYQNCYIWAEKVSLLNSVLGNVISNAIKFSNRGEALTIELMDHEGKVDVIIQDHGIGMPQELLGRVFDKSSVTSRAGTENEPGTGFGMPLVKSFMEYYGGQVQIRSTTEAESGDEHGTAVILEFQKCG